jgi:hypothetical protein
MVNWGKKKDKPRKRCRKCCDEHNHKRNDLDEKTKLERWREDWRKKQTNEKYMESHRERQHIAAKELTDGYIKKLLMDTGLLQPDEITPGMIEFKRANVQLKRLISLKKTGVDYADNPRK